MCSVMCLLGRSRWCVVVRLGGAFVDHSPVLWRTMRTLDRSNSYRKFLVVVRVSIAVECFCCWWVFDVLGCVFDVFLCGWWILNGARVWREYFALSWAFCWGEVSDYWLFLYFGCHLMRSFSIVRNSQLSYVLLLLTSTPIYIIRRWTLILINACSCLHPSPWELVLLELNPLTVRNKMGEEKGACFVRWCVMNKFLDCQRNEM